MNRIVLLRDVKKGEGSRESLSLDELKKVARETIPGLRRIGITSLIIHKDNDKLFQGQDIAVLLEARSFSVISYDLLENPLGIQHVLV